MGSGLFVGICPVVNRVLLAMVATFCAPADAVPCMGNFRVRAERCNRTFERPVFRSRLA